jgi:sugar O-acyltransferase (sialic acid O-acetyltransferase NeuD family)
MPTNPMVTADASLPIVVMGGGGHSTVVIEACLLSCQPVAGVIAPAARRLPGGVALLGNDDLLNDAAFVAAHRFVPAVGAAALRRHLAGEVVRRAGRLATIVHPSAIVSPFAVLGEGTVVCAGAVVGFEASVGRLCILNTACSVDHHCIVGEATHIAPGVRLAGEVECGEEVLIGIGAVVLPGRRIGAHARIGAGAVVCSDVLAGVTVVGLPARPRPAASAGADRSGEEKSHDAR